MQANQERYAHILSDAATFRSFFDLITTTHHEYGFQKFSILKLVLLKGKETIYFQNHCPLCGREKLQRRLNQIVHLIVGCNFDSNLAHGLRLKFNFVYYS